MDSHLHENDNGRLDKGIFVTTVPGYYMVYVGERSSVPELAQALCRYE